MTLDWNNRGKLKKLIGLVFCCQILPTVYILHDSRDSKGFEDLASLHSKRSIRIDTYEPQERRSEEAAIVDIKVKNDHRSKFSNLSNWKEEAWKNQGFNGIRTRDLRDTGAMLYQLGYEATHREWGQFIEFISLVRSEMMWSIYEIIHIFGCHGFESRWSLDFFRLLLSNCLNWKIYCDGHFSLWSTTAIQIYELFHIYFTSFHSSREIWTQ